MPMLSTFIGDVPFVPEPTEQFVGQYRTHSIVHRRQPTGEIGALILTTRRIVFYRSGSTGSNLALTLYYTEIRNIRKGSVSGSKFIEISGNRFYLGRPEVKAVFKLIKFGRRGNVKRMGAHPIPVTPLQPPTMQQPAYQQRPTYPQTTMTADPIYRKGLEAVADDIVNQIAPKTAAVAPVATAPQTVTTVSASRSMVMKPVVKTAETIISAEAVAAKRAMLERVLAPQSREAQALASEVMGSIASTKAVKGLKKGAAGATGDDGTTVHEFDNTENEVTAIKEQKICIVHKGPISGAIFLCPKCETFYCMKCATYLKKNGEKCWSCKAEIDVPDIEA